MKLLLLFLLLSVCCSLLHAQNIRIKDSTVYYNNGVLSSSFVTTSTYNSDCLVDTTKSANGRTIYTYNPDKTVYQELGQNLDQNTGEYVDGLRGTFQYNNAGNVTFRLYETFDVDNNVFVNYRRDSLFYNVNNQLITSIIQDWDTPTSTWITSSEVDWFYNNQGQIDSIVNQYFPYSVSKTYITYFDAPSKSYREKTYNYYDNNLLLIGINTHYIDSANYIKKDSMVSEVFDKDSVLTGTSGSIYTIYYNTDNTIKELNNYFINTSSNDTIINKTFFFYAPCSAVLPVTFLSFSGERQNNHALLHWRTANEINTASFNIQRSTDGEHFITIGSTTATGSSGTGKNYTYTDANAFLTNVPKLYYRLAAKNKNGATNYSKTIMLDVTAGKLYVYVSPNPVANAIYFFAATSINHAAITVTDLRGKVLYAATQQLSAGSKVAIDASRFSKGMYIVTVRSASIKQEFKVLKE